MFKQKRKTIYIILLGLIFILIISIRPILIRLEMKKVHPINNEKSYYTFFYQMKDKSEVLESTFTKDEQGNYCFHAFRSEAKCLNKDEIKILSTKNDQELIKNYVRNEYLFKSNQLIFRFEDLNKDGIDDFLMFSGTSNNDARYAKYINFYSSDNDKLIWQIEEAIGDVNINIEFIKNTNNLPIIVVYNYGLTSGADYNFYKSIDGVYQKVIPTRDNWTAYWKKISTIEIFFDRFLGIWSLIFSLIYIIYIILPISIIILLLRFILKRRKLGKP